MTKKPLKWFKILGKKVFLFLFVDWRFGPHKNRTASEKSGRDWPLCTTDTRRRGWTRGRQKIRYAPR